MFGIREVRKFLATATDEQLIETSEKIAAFIESCRDSDVRATARLAMREVESERLARLQAGAFQAAA